MKLNQYVSKDRNRNLSNQLYRHENTTPTYVSSQWMTMDAHYLPTSRLLRTTLTEPTTPYTHRVSSAISIPLITSFLCPRWNFNKVHWTWFIEELDKCLGLTSPTSESYKDFVGAMIASSKNVYQQISMVSAEKVSRSYHHVPQRDPHNFKLHRVTYYEHFYSS